MPTTRLTKLLFVLSLLATGIMLIASYDDARDERELSYYRKKQVLLEIASQLDNGLTGSFDQILIDANQSNIADKDKIQALNKVLQPKVDALSQKYPGYGLGYYSRDLNSNISVAPFAPSFLQPIKRTVVYDTGKFEFEYIEKAILWEEKPAISVRYPIYRDGNIIGHSFANSKIEDVEAVYMQELYTRFFRILIIWLASLAIIYYIGYTFRQCLIGLTRSIKEASRDVSSFKEIPELLPILETTLELRETIQRERDKVHRLDRFNLIGEMAAGVAHEIRNPLTVIKGYLQFIRLKVAGMDEQFVTILKELSRVEDIITDFLSLARNKKIENKAVNLNVIFNEIYPLLLAESLKKGVELKVRLSCNMADIYADEKEMKQLILNLARNGIESIEGHGIINISTTADHNLVTLSISDSGCGIPGESIKKIFDPFYTTKNEGTGLGLSVCQSIVERHGGNIEVISHIGKGTTFIITFPVLIS